MKTILLNKPKRAALLLLCLFLQHLDAQTVTTFAGSVMGYANGTGVQAQFSNNNGIASDALGNIYVADTYNNRIRKITPAGVVSTLAGNSSAGFANGTGAAAQFSSPDGVAVDGLGNVYVADTNNFLIRKITPAGVVTTLAGSSAGFADGTGSAAKFFNPAALAADSSGTVYVADTANYRIRKITPAGVVTTLAGSSYGFNDGVGAAALFSEIYGIAVAADGIVYVADSDNNRIRQITPDGQVTTLAGGSLGTADGTGAAAQFNNPAGLDIDASGTLFVADEFNDRIRRITPAGVVTTLAGSIQGFANGIGSAAQFYHPYDLTISPGGFLVVSDQRNNLIRKVGVDLGVGDYELANKVLIYPNPVSSLLTVKLGDAVAASITLFDMNGREIYFEKPTGNETVIDLGIAARGVYLIKINADKGMVVKKIVKQ